METVNDEASVSSDPERDPEGEQGQDRPEKPRFRAYYEVTKKKDRARPPNKWDKGRKVWMRLSPTEPFNYLKWVKDLDYNEKRGGWDYQLRNKDETIYGWVEEDNTKRA